MPQVIVRDTLISYKDSGKGKTLICLHGWMHSASAFDNLTQELEKNYRIISLDLPNFGASQIDKGIISLDDYEEFLSDFIDKLNIRDYSLVGHSMGGQIIIRATSKGFVSPDNLVLIASAGIRDNRKRYKLFLKFMSIVFRHVTPKHLKNRIYKLIGSDYNADLSAIHKQIIDKTLSTDILLDAQSLKVKTLLIYGESDKSTPVWMGAKLHHAIQGSVLSVVKAENHWLHQTSAREVGEIIKGFVG